MSSGAGIIVVTPSGGGTVGARISQPTGQTFAAGVLTQVEFPTIVRDSSPSFTDTANVLIVPSGEDGTYCAVVNLRLLAAGTGFLRIVLKINSASIIQHLHGSPGGADDWIGLTFIDELVGGDEVRIDFESSAGTDSLQPSTFSLDRI